MKWLLLLTIVVSIISCRNTVLEWTKQTALLKTLPDNFTKNDFYLCFYFFGGKIDENSNSAVVFAYPKK